MKTAKRKATAAVALLEMMVALIIMGFIAIIIASSLGFLGQVLTRTETSGLDVEQEIAIGQLERLARDMPPGVHPEQKYMLEGTAERLTFWTLDKAVGSSKAKAIRVSVEVQGNELIFLDGGSQRLASDITDLKILYYADFRSEISKTWHKDWLGEISLPDLVKIEWNTSLGPAVPILLEPGLTYRQRYRSLSSLVPPG